MYIVDWSVLLLRRDCSSVWNCGGQELKSVVWESCCSFVVVCGCVVDSVSVARSIVRDFCC